MTAADFDERLAHALGREVPPQTAASADWTDALGRARAGRRRRALVVFAAASAAAVSLALATPLGGAIVRTFDDFSSWVTGQPGEPVSREEQRAFDEANARSWNGFPGTPELRRLIRTTVGGITYDLLGFRTGSSLCLQVRARGDSRGGARKTTCSPLADLRSATVPARVLLADWGYGRGEKRATFGTETFRSSRAHVTAGIVADDVRAIEIRDDHGLQRVRPRSNAFLYVADRPEVGQRVTRVWVIDERGVRRATPFAPAPFGFGGGPPSAGRKHAPGPTHVERRVSGGTIGWLMRSEPRGEPLSVLAPGLRASMRWMRGKFARVVTPDPEGLKRVVLGFGTYPARPETPVSICTALLQRGGASGGCSSLDVFERGPFTVGLSLFHGSDQFMTLSGIASDDVATLEAFLATGERRPVPLRDNAFVVDLPRGKFPVRLVAYDDDRRVIGIREQGDPVRGPAPVRGRARVVARATSGDGSVAELSVSPSTDGGQCHFVRIDGPTAVRMSGCEPRRWRGGALHLSTTGSPARFVQGAVRNDVAAVEIRYADGTGTRTRPREGYVLYAVPEAHVTEEAPVVALVGLDTRGRELGSLSLRHPR